VNKRERERERERERGREKEREKKREGRERDITACSCGWYSRSTRRGAAQVDKASYSQPDVVMWPQRSR